MNEQCNILHVDKSAILSYAKNELCVTKDIVT